MIQQELVPELSSGEFDKFIKSDGLVVIGFFADWCMNCVMMGPVIEDLSEIFKDRIKFARVDLEENKLMAQKFGVHSVPNLVLFRDGTLVDHFIGSIPAYELEEKLEKFFLNQ